MPKTLEEGLHLVLLEQYGFERALEHEEISDKDLKLIENATDDDTVRKHVKEIQHEREIARQQCEYEELQVAIERYPENHHPRTRANVYIKNKDRSTLLSALPKASQADKMRIEKALEIGSKSQGN